MNDSEGAHLNSLSAVSQSPAQREPLQSDPADLGDTGNSPKLDIALTVVKESLKVIARVGGACAPLKAVAEGLGVIFDRIDVSLLSSVPILSM